MVEAMMMETMVVEATMETAMEATAVETAAMETTTTVEAATAAAMAHLNGQVVRSIFCRSSRCWTDQRGGLRLSYRARERHESRDSEKT